MLMRGQGWPPGAMALAKAAPGIGSTQGQIEWPLIAGAAPPAGSGAWGWSGGGISGAMGVGDGGAGGGGGGGVGLAGGRRRGGLGSEPGRRGAPRAPPPRSGGGGVGGRGL